MSELLRKQVVYWKKCFEETGFKYKKLEEENKLLTMCQCGEFDIEFNRHCNSCVKDRIEKLETKLFDTEKVINNILAVSFGSTSETTMEVISRIISFIREHRSKYGMK